MNKYKDLLFDLDHTLWDFDRNSIAALNDLFHLHSLGEYFSNFESFKEEYHHINSMLWKQYNSGKISKHTVKYGRFSNCLEKAGCMDKELAKKLADEYVELSPCKTYLIDGALDLVQSLQGSYRMHIITNGFNEVQYKKIRFSGLEPYFDNVFTSENAGFQKPDTGFFQYVFQNNQIRVESSLVIGDNLLTDISGAKEYGIDTVFFNPGAERDFIGASFEIHHLNELLNFL